MAVSKKKNSKSTASKKAGPGKGTSRSAAAAKQSRQPAPEIKPEPIPLRGILAVLFLALAVLNIFSCAGVDAYLTNGIRTVLTGLLGSAGYYLMCLVWLLLFYVHTFSRGRPIVWRTLACWGLVAGVGGIAQLSSGVELPKGFFAGVKALWAAGAAGKGGGVLGGAIGNFLRLCAGKALAVLILCLTTVVCLLAIFRITPASLVRAIRNRPRPEPEPAQEEQPDPASVMVNHFANKHIQRVERKRQEKQQRFDMKELSLDPQTSLGEDEAKQGTGRKNPRPLSPDEYLARAEKRPEPDEQPDEQPFDAFDGDPFTGDTPLSEAEQTQPLVQKGEQTDEVLTAAAEAGEVFEPVRSEPLPAPEPEPVEAEQVGGESAPGEPSFSEDAPEKHGLDVASVRETQRAGGQETAQSAEEVAQEIDRAAAVPAPVYRFPPMQLLHQAKEASSDSTEEMRENARRLEETLASFKINAQLCNVTRGPTVTRYEIELERGVRLAKITSLADDIALNLGATGVRVAAIPDKISVVGIEVPNKQVTMVTLREVLSSSAFIRAKSKVTFAAGKDISGTVVLGDIARMPHLMIAGTTGSGKSVCINSILISILYKSKPDEVKFIMVDPKMVELGIYNGIPHLLIPVVTDPKKAAGALQWAVTEMMRRYKTMASVNTRDIDAYNKLMEETQGEKMPKIVVVIDELADLMLVAAKDVEASICHIAQMGRASGIHLVVATQRPSADVITGLMRANIPSKIAFAVSSPLESRIIMGASGAEKLVGRGDMLFCPQGQAKGRRVQGCFVSDEEVEQITSFIKENAQANYSEDVMAEIEQKAEQSDRGPGSAEQGEEPQEQEYDELLPAAVEVFLDIKMASVSVLQRKLKLGYARAARIVDEMEEMGIVGPFAGSKGRQLLITREQWEQMQGGQMSIQETPEPVPEEID